MHKILSLAVSCACLLFISTLAAATLDELKNTTPAQRASALTQMMTEALSLDEAASRAVSDINLRYAKQTQVLMESNGPQQEKLMAFRKNSQAKDAELKTLLSAEQYSEYREKKSEIETMGKQTLFDKFEIFH